MSGPHTPHPITKNTDHPVGRQVCFWAVRTPHEYIPGEKEKILRLFGMGMELLFLDKPHWTLRELRNFTLQFDKDIQKRIVLNRPDSVIEKRTWGRELKNRWNTEDLNLEIRTIMPCRNVASLMREYQKFDYCIVPEELQELLLQLPENISRHTIVSRKASAEAIISEEENCNILLQGANVYDTAVGAIHNT